MDMFYFFYSNNEYIYDKKNDYILFLFILYSHNKSNKISLFYFKEQKEELQLNFLFFSSLKIIGKLVSINSLRIPRKS